MKRAPISRHAPERYFEPNRQLSDAIALVGGLCLGMAATTLVIAAMTGALDGWLEPLMIRWGWLG